MDHAEADAVFQRIGVDVGAGPRAARESVGGTGGDPRVQFERADPGFGDDVRWLPAIECLERARAQ